MGEIRGDAGAVLVVENERAILDVVSRALERAGYSVLVAANGHEALTLPDRHEGAIDLLLADVAMPVMSGVQLATWPKGTRPQIRVLYRSGHWNHVVRRRGVFEAEADFIAKRFSCSELVTRVRGARCAHRPAAEGALAP